MGDFSSVKPIISRQLTPYRQNNHYQHVIPNFIHQAITDRAQLDLVAIRVSREPGRRDARLFQPLGELFLELRADWSVQFAPFVERIGMEVQLNRPGFCGGY